jgi:hypothetical protein
MALCCLYGLNGLNRLNRPVQLKRLQNNHLIEKMDGGITSGGAIPLTSLNDSFRSI